MENAIYNPDDDRETTALEDLCSEVANLREALVAQQRAAIATQILAAQIANGGELDIEALDEVLRMADKIQLRAQIDPDWIARSLQQSGVNSQKIQQLVDRVDRLEVSVGVQARG